MSTRDFCIPQPRRGDWSTHPPTSEPKSTQWDVDKARERLIEFISQSGAVVGSLADGDYSADEVAELLERFHRLAAEWDREVGNISSLTAMTRHPKYREIIDLGWKVVPLMLDDLQRNRGFWFLALNEITGIRPFDPRDAGNTKRMTEAWLKWGKFKRII